MTVEEIFSKLSSHMAKGLMVHDQIATMYNFLNLDGYKKCHEYHYYEENCNYRKIKNYYTDRYEKLIKPAEIEEVDIISNNWYKISKIEVDANTKRSMIRDLVKQWIKWETETREDLQVFYKELYNLSEIKSALKIEELIVDVEEELKEAKKKLINLENINYDMVYIIDEQDQLCKKYQEKIDNMEM